MHEPQTETSGAGKRIGSGRIRIGLFKDLFAAAGGNKNGVGGKLATVSGNIAGVAGNKKTAVSG